MKDYLKKSVETLPEEITEKVNTLATKYLVTVNLDEKKLD